MINFNKILPHQAHQGSFPACFAFSLHKAGSTLMNKMIQEACQLANIPCISIADTFFRMNVPTSDWENDERLIEKITPGRIYYGFRHLPKVFLSESLRLKEKKSVLLVRDPRDAMVSQYFSFGGKYISHKTPDRNKKAFLKRLRSTAHMDIDEYVLHAATLYNERLNAYKDNLNFENVALFKYEDIYYDKGKFLGDIFTHFDIAVAPDVLKEVAAKNDVRPEVEDVSKHIRQGTPGDHMNKLHPETISKLNEIFSEACAWYGYDLIG